MGCGFLRTVLFLTQQKQTGAVSQNHYSKCVDDMMKSETGLILMHDLYKDQEIDDLHMEIRAYKRYLADTYIQLKHIQKELKNTSEALISVGKQDVERLERDNQTHPDYFLDSCSDEEEDLDTVCEGKVGEA